MHARSIAVNGGEMALPTDREGTDLDPVGSPDFDDLPPHRAAIPVPPIILSEALRPRYNPLTLLSIIIAMVLHGGLVAAALIWGQGGELPAPEVVAVELVEERGPEPQTMAAVPEGVGGQDAFAAAGADRASVPQETAGTEDIPAATTSLPTPDRTSPKIEDQPVASTESNETLSGEERHSALLEVREEDAATNSQTNIANVPLPTRRRGGPVEKLRAVLAAGSPAPPLPSTEPTEAPPAEAAAGTYLPSPANHPRNFARSNTARRLAVAMYARRVRAQIGQYLPLGNLGPGRVAIGLLISPSGGLRRALVLRSSGNRTMDRAALLSVRRANPYSRPPLGQSAAQLRLVLEFQFE